MFFEVSVELDQVGISRAKGIDCVDVDVLVTGTHNVGLESGFKEMTRSRLSVKVPKALSYILAMHILQGPAG